MDLKKLGNMIKDYGVRGSAVLIGDRVLKRPPREVSYAEWMKAEESEKHREKKEDRADTVREESAFRPLIGILAHMDMEDRVAFTASVKAQTYDRYAAYKNCPEAEYFLIVQEGCRLEPDLLSDCCRLLEKNRDQIDGSKYIDLIYFDSDRYTQDGERTDPAFRPEFDPHLLRQVNYMGPVVLVSAQAAHRAGLPGPGEGELHAFLRRVCDGANVRAGEERTGAIRHIPKMLYHVNSAPSKEEDGCAEQTPASGHQECGTSDEKSTAGCADGSTAGSSTTGSADGSTLPLVSVLIPNKDHLEDLGRCIDSLLHVNTWQNLEILIIENNSVLNETFAFYDKLCSEDERIRVLRYEGNFNYSAVNNFGAENALGDYLLLLNNDTKITEPDSIASLVGLASESGVGAAGALLFYPEGTVQHAGIILGHGGIAGHAWAMRMPPWENEKEGGDSFVRTVFSHTRNVSAATGACLMMRREVYRECGGLDESLEVTFNDVDLCLRLRGKGYRIVVCPQAQLTHYESASRGAEDSSEKVARFHREIGIFVKRWQRELEEGDPFYNPNLTLTGPGWTCRDHLREAKKPYLKYLHMARTEGHESAD